jgi:histidinol dehydrogenase
MIRIFEDTTAAQEILQRRKMTTVDEVPPTVLNSIERVFGEPLTPEQAVARLLADVRDSGDAVLRTWTYRIDGLTLDHFEVPKPDWEKAYNRLDTSIQNALARAVERIREFHTHQPITDWSTDALGGQLGQRMVPMQQVGVYVPGGTAPLPSSMLMAVIPARVAGVKEIFVSTPADRQQGSVTDIMLAAAYVSGVDRLFCLGGALAVAAFAYGTESVPRVDKIVGAGGLFTTIAKRQVFGQVGLDGLYGPTETVIIADDTANADWVAADLLAQAEHDVLATAILLTPSRRLATRVQQAAARQISTLTRAGIIEESLAGQGGIVITPDVDTAVQLADDFAPEHLCLSVETPEKWVDSIHNAAGIFVGEHSFEVLGDYVAGPSHIMPTGGTARFKGPVNVLDFVKVINIIGLDPGTARKLAPDAARVATAEGLTAHAAAAEFRAEETSRGGGA